MDRKSERGGGDAIVANEKRRVIEKRRFTSTPTARGRDGMVYGVARWGAQLSETGYKGSATFI